MDSLSEISAVYEHKKQLEKRLAALKEEAKHAEQMEQDAQMRCERENLDMRSLRAAIFDSFGSSCVASTNPVCWRITRRLQRPCAL